MARLSRFAIAAVTSTAITLLLTYGTYSLHLWVGGHLSVRDFILRSLLPFPIVVGLVAGLWPSPHLRRSPLTASAIGAVVGLAYGYLAPRVLFSHAMGQWLVIEWEIDFAALVCAITAGTCAMLLSVTARSRLALMAAAILVLIAVLVPGPAFDLINRNHELTVAIVIPCKAVATKDEPHVLTNGYSTPVDVGGVTDHVMRLIRDEGITGQYRVSHLYRQGHGTQALVVIVLNQPVVSEVQLPQPCGGNVIYLQQPDGWKKIPAQFPAVGLSLTLRPPISDRALGGLTINEAGGWSTGFEIWKAAN
jgi:hypothetical protein